ncbi:hypothetical protein MHYP_G00355370 [Metynnis hypsauchen]
MATTAVPDNHQRNGFMVVTQLVPAAATGQNIVGAGPGVSTFGVPVVTPVNNINTVTSAPGPLQKFLKSQPQALGTVQIMIGIITFLFGVVLTVVQPTISVYSGVVYWSPLFVKGSLGMNVVSAIIAATAFILLLMDFLVYQYQYDSCDSTQYYYYDCLCRNCGSKLCNMLFKGQSIPNSQWSTGYALHPKSWRDCEQPPYRKSSSVHCDLTKTRRPCVKAEKGLEKNYKS